MSGEQAIFNLEIKKKSGLSLNPDIHHSKVFSSDRIYSLKYRRSTTLGFRVRKSEFEAKTQFICSVLE